jgi:hypothetical protein
VGTNQTEIKFAPPRDVAEMSEQEIEERAHSVLLRLMEDAAEEVTRKEICFALDINEKLLSKQLRETEGHRPSFRLLAYLIKKQKSGRLARWLMADYAEYMPPQRPAMQRPETTLELIYARAQAGDYGKAAREEIRELYERTEKGGRP